MSMFLHGSILHLAGNMLFLWIFGNNVEDHLGPIMYAIFYGVTGVAAMGAHFLADPGSTVPVIGASGAIAGVMGAYLVFWPRAKVLTMVPVLLFFVFYLPAGVVLGIWFAMQFLTNPNEGVAWLAHVGGFAAGVLIALALKGVLGPPRARPPEPEPEPPLLTSRSERGDELRARARADRSATNGGGGSGMASPPGRASGDVTPERTSANGQPRASASAPSELGRSPTTTPVEPNRARTSSAMGRSGLPATSGLRPDAVATAAAIAPDPGIRPPATG